MVARMVSTFLNLLTLVVTCFFMPAQVVVKRDGYEQHWFAEKSYIAVHAPFCGRDFGLGSVLYRRISLYIRRRRETHSLGGKSDHERFRQ
jgi:hypothetical protein